MKTNRKNKQNKIARILGADRVVHLKSHGKKGPLGWLQLAQEVQDSLQSTGGRPSVPERDIKRLVPFNEHIWSQLSRKANTFSRKGNKISPAQLAAFLVEKGFAELNAISLKKGTKISILATTSK